VFHADLSEIVGPVRSPEYTFRCLPHQPPCELGYARIGQIAGAEIRAEIAQVADDDLYGQVTQQRDQVGVVGQRDDYCLSLDARELS